MTGKITMELFEELRAVALRQNLDNEFPSWLLSDVMTIADEPELSGEKTHLIELLIDQISDFDLSRLSRNWTFRPLDLRVYQLPLNC